MSLKGKHIVAIDDTHSILTFLRISLEEHGATFSGAVTAAGGLALCEAEKPDIVVLDIGLPDKEGLDILYQLKRIGKNRDLPVVILTVRKEAETRVLAAQLGGNAFITKPFVMDDLINTIHEKLQIKNDGRLALVKDTGLTGGEAAAATPSDSRYRVP